MKYLLTGEVLSSLACSEAFLWEAWEATFQIKGKASVLTPALCPLVELRTGSGQGCSPACSHLWYWGEGPLLELLLSTVGSPALLIYSEDWNQERWPSLCHAASRVGVRAPEAVEAPWGMLGDGKGAWELSWGSQHSDRAPIVSSRNGELPSVIPGLITSCDLICGVK